MKIFYRYMKFYSFRKVDEVDMPQYLKEFASSYERYKTFIAFPRRYKILKPSDLVDTKIHLSKLLKKNLLNVNLKTMFLLNFS